MRQAPQPSAIWTPILAARLDMLSAVGQHAGKRGLAMRLIGSVTSGRAKECRRRREHDRCRSCGRPL